MTILEVQCRGNHRALGRAHGEATGGAIRAALTFYEGLAARRASSIEELATPLGHFVDPARRALPHLVEEMEGIAEGAEVDSEAIFFLNALEELWPAEACTTMTHGSLLLHAEQWYAGHAGTVLVCARPSERRTGRTADAERQTPPFISPTCAGCLPAVGMSAGGFAQGIDSLTDPGDRAGIPRVLVSRHALGQPDLTSAIAAATIGGRAGGYAHTLVTARRSVVVETTATEQWTLSSVGAHANHRLSASPGSPASRGSVARLERARELLANTPPSSLEDGARLLADHDSAPQSICLHEEGPEASATIFGMVCDLATGRMLVSDGPPCAGRWLEAEVPGFGARESALVG